MRAFTDRLFKHIFFTYKLFPYRFFTQRPFTPCSLIHRLFSPTAVGSICHKQFFHIFITDKHITHTPYHIQTSHKYMLHPTDSNPYIFWFFLPTEFSFIYIFYPEIWYLYIFFSHNFFILIYFSLGH